MTSSSPPKRLRKHSQNEFITLMISSKRLPSSSYHQITELNLSNLQLNQIASFPFEYLPKLLSLDLSYNQLITINPDWSKSHVNLIEKLNVSHNKLETLVFLKDFKYLKTLNVTENLLRTNERFLSLHLCSTIEQLIDSNQDQIEDDQLKLDQWLQIIETKTDRLWALSYYDKYKQESVNEKNNQIAKRVLDDFHHAMIKIFEKQANFSQMHLSPLANYLIGNKINELCSSAPKAPSKKSLKTHLTADFNELMDTKTQFEPIKFLRCHQMSENDLTTVSVRLSAFEPNTSQHILATCGGQKVCFIDCDTCEVTHLYEVASLRSTAMPTGRKIKDKHATTNAEHFSCLCWMEIPDGNENLKVLAVGATNGHIYLLAHKWKIMFGHIELPASSINCLTWHPSNASTLVVGSYHTVRFMNIQSYLDRLLTFVRKQNKPTAKFDYVETPISSMNKTLPAHIYYFDNGDDSVLQITDLLFYSISKDDILLLVGTTSGLFVIRDQTPVKLTFPKSVWTVGEHIESIRLIDNQTRLIAINILGLDQIFCFDLEQSLPPNNQQLHISLTLSNPYRQIPTKMATCVTNNENDNSNASFECILGSDHGSFFYHQIRMISSNKKSKKPTFDNKRSEISWPQMKTSQAPSLLSASLNDTYLCLTTSNNLICIYKRK